jgi:hypothetical protein
LRLLDEARLLFTPLYPSTVFLAMLAKLRFSTIQSGLVLFWAIWLTLVTLTNFADAMRQLDVLPSDFKFASYNFDLVKKTVGAHGIPTSVAGVLFAGVILWELLGSILFWRAWRVMRRDGNSVAEEVAQAFAVSLALWAAFLIATEATGELRNRRDAQGNPDRATCKPPRGSRQRFAHEVCTSGLADFREACDFPITAFSAYPPTV